MKHLLRVQEIEQAAASVREDFANGAQRICGQRDGFAPVGQHGCAAVVVGQCLCQLALDFGADAAQLLGGFFGPKARLPNARRGRTTGVEVVAQRERGRSVIARQAGTDQVTPLGSDLERHFRPGPQACDLAFLIGCAAQRQGVAHRREIDDRCLRIGDQRRPIQRGCLGQFDLAGLRLKQFAKCRFTRATAAGGQCQLGARFGEARSGAPDIADQAGSQFVSARQKAHKSFARLHVEPGQLEQPPAPVQLHPGLYRAQRQLCGAALAPRCAGDFACPPSFDGSARGPEVVQVLTQGEPCTGRLVLPRRIAKNRADSGPVRRGIGQRRDLRSCRSLDLMGGLDRSALRGTGSEAVGVRRRSACHTLAKRLERH